MVAVADAAAADAVVVDDVECCGGGVDVRVRCAERERREEDEEDDDDVEDEVEEAGDAAADRYLEETGLLEREFLRAAAELGLSSAGVSGGREGRAGSGAVAAAAAATMPCRAGAAAGDGGDLATRGGPEAMQVPRAPDSPAPLLLPLRPPLPVAGAFRIDDAPVRTRRSSELVKKCLQFERRREEAKRSEVGILREFFFSLAPSFAVVLLVLCLALLWFRGSLLVSPCPAIALLLCVPVWVGDWVWCGHDDVPTPQTSGV